MKRKLPVFILCAAALLFSCKKHTSWFSEITDDGLTIQAAKMDAVNGDESITTYKARLLTGKKWISKAGPDVKGNLLYRMDSCFYLLRNGRKIYASLTQPVANGTDNSFEYLLEFETGTNVQADLVYRDRYITGKTYRLKPVHE